MTPAEIIPVLRPRLPAADRLLPYLRQIDATRRYSNWGPLVTALEQRVASQLGLPAGSVVSAGSGTAALVGAILASAGRARPDRPLAILPAFTFVATASATVQCGYRPYLIDIDEDRWLVDPDALDGHPLLAHAGVVVPVATFGRPVAQAPWIAFRERTGLPVVIDGAASVERLEDDPRRLTGDIPVALSFHATKSFATGEGGAVVTADPAVGSAVVEALNFGFFDRRESRVPSINGKMSEYHAAVGLAELDDWPAKRRAFGDVADRYRDRFAASGLAGRLVATPAAAGCYVLYLCADAREAEAVERSLSRSGIGFRRWYGGGLNAQPCFHDVPHDRLAVTERLAPLVIGLPVAPDLSDAEIDRIAGAVERGAVETALTAG